MRIFCLLIILLLIDFGLGQKAFFASIDTSSTLAGSTVTHFVTATFTNYSLIANSYLYLNYSAGWTLSSIARANSGDFCENSCTLGIVAIASSGNNIRINNFFPSSTTMSFISLGISLSNIVNPKVSISDTVSLTLFDNAGTLI